MIERIHDHFGRAYSLYESYADSLSEPIAHAIETLFHVLSHDGKIFACGADNSAFLAQYFIASLQDSEHAERPPLAAIALTEHPGISSRHGYEAVYAQQLQALGQAGDIIIILSANNQAPQLMTAIDTAHEKSMQVLLITGQEHDDLSAQLLDTDIHICIAEPETIRVSECQLFILHILSDGIDAHLLGEI